jgi:aconitate hydratase
VVIAAITSCTNTSNPYVMIGAGLVARKAREEGPEGQALGQDLAGAGLSQVVTAYLEAAGLQEDLDALGFNLVGYGCTTCIGNSGPLPAPISKAINDNDLVAVLGAVGQPQLRRPVSPGCAANYLASPPLVVAYALAGT